LGRILRVDGGYCGVQATYNKAHAYQHLHLRVVVGSLGIGKQNPFFEYGDRHYQHISQFFRPALSSFEGSFGNLFEGLFGGSDMHVWLEDRDGKVFDIVEQNMILVAQWRKLSVSVKAGDIVEGVTKEELRRKGLHYVPANARILDELGRVRTLRYGNMIQRLDVMQNV
jgi:hypothetical protein